MQTPCADCHAQADLAHAFGDRHQQNVHDSDAAHEQRDRRHRGEQQRHDLAAALGGCGNLAQIAHREIGVGTRPDAMATTQGRGHLGNRRWHRLRAFRLQIKLVHETGQPWLQPVRIGRRRRRAGGGCGLFPGDDEVVRLQVARNDFGEAVIIEAGDDRHRQLFPIAQQPQRCRPLGSRRLARPGVAQRLIRHAERIRPGIDDDLGGRGHAGFQRQILVVHAGHHIIGHHILHGLRRLAYLDDRAGENPPGKGIDGEVRRAALLDDTDIALADIGIDLHLGEVRRDQKQRRGLEGGGDGLAHGDIARHHRAIDRGNNVGIAEIDLGGVEQGLTQFDGGLIKRNLGDRLIIGTFGVVGEVLRGEAAGGEAGVAGWVGLGIDQDGLVLRQLRLGDIKIGLVLIDHRLIGTRVDLGANLALLHRGVVVAGNLLDHPGNIRTDNDRQHWINRAGRGNGAGHRPPDDRRGGIGDRGSAQRRPAQHAGGGDKNKPDHATNDPAPAAHMGGRCGQWLGGIAKSGPGMRNAHAAAQHTRRSRSMIWVKRRDQL